jgi:hypothetical protein
MAFGITKSHYSDIGLVRVGVPYLITGPSYSQNILQFGITLQVTQTSKLTAQWSDLLHESSVPYFDTTMRKTSNGVASETGKTVN